MRRRALLRLPALVATAAGATGLLAGCGSLLPTPGTRQWYQLDDRRPSGPATTGPQASGARAGTGLRRPRLLIVAGDAGALYESTGIVHGSEPGRRAYYQLANWTERPGRRIVGLLDARLNARSGERGAFETVALEASGLRTDWILTLRLKDFFHDTTPTPDRAVVTIDAELIDWSQKSLLSRQLFRTERNLLQEDAGGAVSALSEAIGEALDAIVEWLERQARGFAAE